MKVVPKSKTHYFTGQPRKVYNYRQIAAIVVAFMSVFYFFFKVVFGI